MIRRLARAVFFWPAALVMAAGRALVTLADKPVGRLTIRPVFRLFCRVALYARPLRFLRSASHQIVPADDISALLRKEAIIAAIPCACRAGRTRCGHPLHAPHESDTCLSFGLAAVLQIGSGLGKRMDAGRVRDLFERAAASGMVHHAIYSMGLLLEVCNCCSETCTAIRAYRSGIPEAVRPAPRVAVRRATCDGCAGRAARVCAQICPYGKQPGDPGCLGCGLCARHCPREAVCMVPRAQAAKPIPGRRGAPASETVLLEEGREGK